MPSCHLPHLVGFWLAASITPQCPAPCAPFSWDFPCDSADKESACNAGDLSSIPGLGSENPGQSTGWLEFWLPIHTPPWTALKALLMFIFSPCDLKIVRAVAVTLPRAPRQCRACWASYEGVLVLCAWIQPHLHARGSHPSPPRPSHSLGSPWAYLNPPCTERK